MFLFLNWNLFLAALPWLFSQFMIQKETWINRYTMLLLLGSWLLFFPNSPYILTDLFHLQKGQPMPMWYDLFLILSFAWTGLLFGFLSLMKIEEIALKKLKPTSVHILIVSLLFMASFGVYLGRFLRWNSWDILSNPKHLLQDIASRIINPDMHLRTWGVTLILGTFLSLVYFSLSAFKRDVSTDVTM